jgi:hypothetical protein
MVGKGKEIKSKAFNLSFWKAWIQYPTYAWKFSMLYAKILCSK